MLQTFYDLKLIGINSINTSNKFNFIASRIIFKIYLNKIKLLKFSSTILNILMFEA